jgi:hypothetical protein
MGRTYHALSESQIEWIARQPMFFVGTAPAGNDGHVNISPKGGVGTFRVHDPTTVAYLDFIGSGVETIAHLQENGRIVIMFCAFEGAPKIVRVHGRGRVVQQHDPEFADLCAKFAPSDDARNVLRSIIIVEANRISDSCGFGVPRMSLVEERDNLFRWAENREQTHRSGWKAAYEYANNRQSIDALPGLSLDEGVDPEHAATLSSVGRVL